MNLKELSVFTRNLAVMARAGLSLTEALEIIKDQEKTRHSKIFGRIIEIVSAGHPLSEALGNYPKIFRKYYISAIKAGEDSGNLEKNLFNLAGQLDKSYSLRQKIKAAMVYPAVVVGLSVIIGFLLTIFVLPKITPLFLGLDMELPFLTRALIAFSDFMRDNGTMSFLGLAALSAVMWRATKIKKIEYFIHRSFLSLPLARRISQSKNLAEFSYTLGTMLKSGLSFDQALEISASTVSNQYYKKALLKAKARVQQGNSLAESLEEHKDIFPIMAIGMVKVGEKSGNLDEELLSLSGLYEQETDSAIQGLASSIEPILLIVIGFVVGLMAVAVITPIYSITGSVYN